mgnify:CR=1 FL=1
MLKMCYITYIEPERYLNKIVIFAPNNTKYYDNRKYLQSARFSRLCRFWF